MVTIKLTPRQYARYKDLGAGRWVKRQLNEPDKPTPA